MASLLTKPYTLVIAHSSAKKSTCVNSLFLSSQFRHHKLSISACVFHFSPEAQPKENENLPFIAQYLISSFGFSKDRALLVATDTHLSPIKTTEQPESVVRFLKDKGLTDVQIMNVVSLTPQLLATSVSKTLEPRSREIISAGFSEDTLVHLIKSNPMALKYKNLLSRLQFWRNTLGNNEKVFLKLLKNRILVNLDIDKRVIPMINLLREYGWSEEEIQNIVKIYPNIVALREEKLKSKMRFLVERAGLDSKCIIKHPYLLAYSLEKRLLPRYCVLSLLKSKGLIESYSPSDLAALSHNVFVQNFIEQYENKVPDLAKLLIAASSGKIETY